MLLFVVDSAHSLWIIVPGGVGAEIHGASCAIDFSSRLSASRFAAWTQGGGASINGQRAASGGRCSRVRSFAPRGGNRRRADRSVLENALCWAEAFQGRPCPRAMLFSS